MWTDSMAAFERLRKSSAHRMADSLEVENVMVDHNTAYATAAERQFPQTAVIRNNSTFFWWGMRWDGAKGNDEESRTWEKILQRTSVEILLIEDPEGLARR